MIGLRVEVFNWDTHRRTEYELVKQCPSAFRWMKKFVGRQANGKERIFRFFRHKDKDGFNLLDAPLGDRFYFPS